MNVGFIGLGRMGQGMARRILSGGHNLAVHDAVASQIADIVAAGATAAATVADVCKDRDVVVTMLVEDAVVTDVALRPGGIRDSLPAGAIHLRWALTALARFARSTAAHADAKQFLVAAPVLGRPDMAASGQLGIVAAGPERCRTPLPTAI